MAVGEKSRAPRSETLFAFALSAGDRNMHCVIGLLACVLTRKVFARRKSFDEVGAVRIKGHVKTFDDPETHLHTGTEQL